MVTVKAMATDGPGQPFHTTDIDRRELGPRDVLVELAWCGICHSDLHAAHREPPLTRYPLVPGHEMTGTIAAVGPDVTRFRVGDKAGIGPYIDSCGECDTCRRGFESYCRRGKVLTYNAVGRDGVVTQGGYSQAIVADEHFVVRIPDTMPLDRAAPMLCAGVTLYSPLRRFGAGPGTRVGIVGFGGLGHVGTQIAHALGADVTVLNLTEEQRADALRLGADRYVCTQDPSALESLKDQFDLVISTVPVTIDMVPYLELLDLDGVLVNLNDSKEPMSIPSRALLTNRRSLVGSLSGGMAEIQEMIDFCAEHGVGAEVEHVDAADVDQAYGRLDRGDVRYRFVIDVATLR